MTEKMEKLKKILSLVNEGLSRKEFTEQFGKLLEFLKKLKEKNRAEFESFNKSIIELSTKLKDDNTASLSGLKDSFIKIITQALKEQENGMNFIRDTLRRIKNGKDGKDGQDGTDGKDGSPDTPAQIANKLEELKGDARLRIEAIKDLKEKLEALEQRPLGGRGGGGVGKLALEAHFVDEEVPVDSGDHLNFTIAAKPNPASSFKLYRNGAKQTLDEDYTLTGRALALLVEFDSANELLTCDYRK